MKDMEKFALWCLSLDVLDYFLLTAKIACIHTQSGQKVNRAVTTLAWRSKGSGFNAHRSPKYEPAFTRFRLATKRAAVVMLCS